MTDRLEHELALMIRNSGAQRVGIAAQRLGTDQAILINPDLSFHPASTIKVCVMLEVYHQAGTRELALHELIPVGNQFSSLADGTAYALAPEDDTDPDLYSRIGESLPLAELVRRMIVRSSNLAANLLLERVTPERTSDFMARLGAPSLRILRGFEDKLAFRSGLNNSATARGFDHVLTQLANQEIVSPASSAEMIAILSQQEQNEMLPAGLPANVRVAHKTGSLTDHFHDVGVIFPPEGAPLVMVILTGGYDQPNAEAAQAFVASLARCIYDHWV
jgi:beta-lactamase class A